MSKIAFVQNYPYDARLGGDGAYIQAFAQFLIGAGHEVHGLVSNIIRGRSSPTYQSQYSLDGYASWTVRKAVYAGRRRFVSVDPLSITRVFAKLTRTALPRLFETSNGTLPLGEARWARSCLDRISPDVTVLVHDAICFAPFLSNDARVFALVGHIPWREIATNEQLQPDCASGKGRLWIRRNEAGLGRADCAGFNSKEDLVYARLYLGLKQALFVGMGYPSKPIARSHTILLFFW